MDKLLDTFDISKVNQGEIINLSGPLTSHKTEAVQDPTSNETPNSGRAYCWVLPDFKGRADTDAKLSHKIENKLYQAHSISPFNAVPEVPARTIKIKKEKCYK